MSGSKRLRKAGLNDYCVIYDLARSAEVKNPFRVSVATGVSDYI